MSKGSNSGSKGGSGGGGGSKSSSGGGGKSSSGSGGSGSGNKMTKEDASRIQSKADTDPNSKTAKSGFAPKAQSKADKNANG